MTKKKVTKSERIKRLKKQFKKAVRSNTDGRKAIKADRLLKKLEDTDV